MKVGVVVFPGSNCDRDALHAATLAGADAELLWHETADLHGADAVILPGGFAHGDYLRAGAIARFSPIMGAVREHAAARRPRAGHLQRLPGADRSRAAARRAAPQHDAALRASLGALTVERRDTPFTRPFPRAGVTLRMPIAHGEGSYYLPDAELDELEAAGQVVFRYAAPEGNPNGSARDIAGVIDERGRVCGLMPHPERASEPMLGSDDGLLLMRSLVESMARVEAAA